MYYIKNKSVLAKRTYSLSPPPPHSPYNLNSESSSRSGSLYLTNCVDVTTPEKKCTHEGPAVSSPALLCPVVKNKSCKMIVMSPHFSDDAFWAPKKKPFVHKKSGESDFDRANATNHLVLRGQGVNGMK